MLTALVWIGTALTLAGLGGILYSGIGAARARRDETDDARLRARLQKLVLWNMAAFGLSALGLMCVVLGVILA